MKRRDLEAYLAQHGCYVHREGAEHTIYFNPAMMRTAALPRHSEIKTPTVREICKRLGIPKPHTR